MAASRAELLRLLEKMQIPISREFLRAIAKMASRARINDLVAALEIGDMTAALEAAGLRAGSWSGLTESIRTAYHEGGAFTMGADVPKRFGAEFDLYNPRVENWLRAYSSQLITFITTEQIEAIQIVLQAGMRAGRNPRSIALDIVGRISKQTGRRAGGIIGLNKPQTIAVSNARVDLETLNSNYFTRVRRDRRFDSVVRKAIDNDKRLPSKTIDKITGRYSDRLLKTRGDTVGRTEALRALNASSDEALRQVIQEGYARPENVTRVWRHSFSPGERPGHLQMSGQKRGVDEPFLNPVTGVSLIHPGTGGAAESINCRCIVEHKIDFIAIELAA